MKSLNIFLLCQIDDPETFRDYANILSRRPQTRTTRTSEQASMHTLVDALSEKRLRFRGYDDFFYSFTIRHIGKEFDLLKIKADKSRILNIELKSEMVGMNRIRKQLIQNRYYLSHITLNIRSYTFVSSTLDVYMLDEEENLVGTTIDRLRDELWDDTGWISDNIETLFDENDYLISPIHTPRRFLFDQYFLTQQQETYKAQIQEAICKFQADPSGGHFLAISGSPGTGKTLLLYDLARSLREKYRICIVHCGKLMPGHLYLKEQGWEIMAVRNIGESFAFEKYDILLVDEAQRIYQNQFDTIKTMVSDLGLVSICACDRRQVLLASEMRRNISLQVEELSGHVFKLSEKIRANRELDSFMRVLLESSTVQDRCTYENIDVLYARTEKECDSFKSNFMNRGYTFINFTSTSLPAVLYRDVLPADKVNMSAAMSAGSEQEITGEYDASRVIGLEFEKVLMVLDDHFYYDEKGVLRARKHPNPDYLYDQLLYQGITRTREKLCLIIVGNFELFRHITEMIRGRY